MPSRLSWLVPIALSLIAGGASGYLFSRPSHSSSAASSPSLDCSLSEERLGKLEEQYASLSRRSSQARTSDLQVTQAVAASTASTGPQAAEFEAAVRSVLARVDGERYESSATRRTQKQSSQIRGFVETVGTQLELPESTRLDVEALLIAKSEEWRDAREAFAQSEQTTNFTSRQRKEARTVLKEKAMEALNAALSEVLTAEQRVRYHALASEERFDLD